MAAAAAPGEEPALTTFDIVFGTWSGPDVVRPAHPQVKVLPLAGQYTHALFRACFDASIPDPISHAREAVGAHPGGLLFFSGERVSGDTGYEVTGPVPAHVIDADIILRILVRLFEADAKGHHYLEVDESMRTTGAFHNSEHTVVRIPDARKALDTAIECLKARGAWVAELIAGKIVYQKPLHAACGYITGKRLLEDADIEPLIGDLPPDFDPQTYLFRVGLRWLRRGFLYRCPPVPGRGPVDYTVTQLKHLLRDGPHEHMVLYRAAGRGDIPPGGTDQARWVSASRPPVVESRSERFRRRNANRVLSMDTLWPCLVAWMTPSNRDVWRGMMENPANGSTFVWLSSRALTRGGAWDTTVHPTGSRVVSMQVAVVAFLVRSIIGRDWGPLLGYGPGQLPGPVDPRYAFGELRWLFSMPWVDVNWATELVNGRVVRNRPLFVAAMLYDDARAMQVMLRCGMTRDFVHVGQNIGQTDPMVRGQFKHEYSVAAWIMARWIDSMDRCPVCFEMGGQPQEAADHVAASRELAVLRVLHAAGMPVDRCMDGIGYERLTRGEFRCFTSFVNLFMVGQTGHRPPYQLGDTDQLHDPVLPVIMQALITRANYAYFEDHGADSQAYMQRVYDYLKSASAAGGVPALFGHVRDGLLFELPGVEVPDENTKAWMLYHLPSNVMAAAILARLAIVQAGSYRVLMNRQHGLHRIFGPGVDGVIENMAFRR